MREIDFKYFYSELSSKSKTKITFSEDELIYYMAFFSAGISAICKVWLLNGLKETPEQMAELINKQYMIKEKI